MLRLLATKLRSQWLWMASWAERLSGWGMPELDLEIETSAPLDVIRPWTAKGKLKMGRIRRV